MAALKGRRQVAKQTKRQLGYTIGRGVLDQISNVANGVRDLIEKGKAIDPRTRQPVELRCAPSDIKRSWSPEQSAAVEEFIATWAIDPEPTPKPVVIPRQVPPVKKKK